MKRTTSREEIESVCECVKAKMKTDKVGEKELKGSSRERPSQSHGDNTKRVKGIFSVHASNWQMLIAFSRLLVFRFCATIRCSLPCRGPRAYVCLSTVSLFVSL